MMLMLLAFSLLSQTRYDTLLYLFVLSFWELWKVFDLMISNIRPYIIKTRFWNTLDGVIRIGSGEILSSFSNVKLVHAIMQTSCLNVIFWHLATFVFFVLDLVIPMLLVNNILCAYTHFFAFRFNRWIVCLCNAYLLRFKMYVFHPVLATHVRLIVWNLLC